MTSSGCLYAEMFILRAEEERQCSGMQGIQAFFFSSRRRHTRFKCDWSSDVCSSDLTLRPKSWYGRRRQTAPETRETLRKPASNGKSRSKIQPSDRPFPTTLGGCRAGDRKSVV